MSPLNAVRGIHQCNRQLIFVLYCSYSYVLPHVGIGIPECFCIGAERSGLSDATCVLKYFQGCASPTNKFAHVHTQLSPFFASSLVKLVTLVVNNY